MIVKDEFAALLLDQPSKWPIGTRQIPLRENSAKIYAPYHYYITDDAFSEASLRIYPSKFVNFNISLFQSYSDIARNMAARGLLSVARSRQMKLSHMVIK